MGQDAEIPNTLRIDPLDNVVTALETVAEGDNAISAAGDSVVVRAEIPAGHKVATEPIPAGDVIRKYGQAIGTAGGVIAPGDWVHTHNLEAVED